MAVRFLEVCENLLQVLSVVGILQDEADPMVSVMKVRRSGIACLPSYLESFCVRLNSLSLSLALSTLRIAISRLLHLLACKISTGLRCLEHPTSACAAAACDGPSVLKLVVPAH